MRQKILILHMGALGDVILSFPVMQLICSSCDHPEVELIGNKEFLEVAGPALGARHIHSINSAMFAPLFSSKATVSDRLQTYLREIDFLFAFLANPDTELAANLSNIFSKRITLVPAIPANGSGKHVTHFQSESVSHLGDISEFLPIRLKFPEIRPDDRRNCRLEKTDRPLVAVHPGSGSPKKCWPEKNFARIIRELVWLGSDVDVLLGPAEPAKKAEYFSACADANIKICRNLSLNQIIRILKRAQAYVGNDSGITHLASALGIPATVLFGPTDFRMWAPLGAQVEILGPSGVDCAPCFDKVFACPSQLCLETITVEKVLSSVNLKRIDAVHNPC